MIDAFSDYTEFIYKRTYSKWDWNKGRREEWSETINRYADFMKENIPTKLHPKLEKCRQAIEQKKVMPSMRSLWSAGPALEKNHIANYNCCYLQIDRPKAFAETLYILLCGTGVGFSVERQFIVNLPSIPCTLNEIDKEIVFEDSKEGWAVGFNELINYLYEGFIPKSDLSKIRPEGAILKTFGGRASGPRPLKRLIDFTVNLFKNAKGRKLNSLECHDLVCCICDVVVVGGVRRSSAISLSNLSDNRMKHAKDGAFWDTHPYRMLANNSVAYTEKPDMTTFMEEWLSLARSGTGERGIFNREACENIVQGIGRRNTNVDWGCNPSLRKGTKILTESGIFPIENLQDNDFYIKNIEGGWSKASCWLSGKNKKLYKINLEGKHSYYATAEHKWPIVTKNGIVKKTTLELNKGDYLPVNKNNHLYDNPEGSYNEGFIIGVLLGDGYAIHRNNNGIFQIGIFLGEDKYNTFGEKIISILRDYDSQANFNKSKKAKCFNLTTTSKNIKNLFTKFGVDITKNSIPKSLWKDSSELFRKGFIDGLFSTDGSVSPTWGMCITSSRENMLIELSELLGFYGIKSQISLSERNNITFPNKKDYNKKYKIYRLRINDNSSILHFKKLFQLSDVKKQNNLGLISKKKDFKLNKIKISSIEETDLYEDVWDIRVDDKDHCFQLSHCITGNCSEIILRPNSFCNLTEVVVRPNDTLHSLCEKVKLATLLGVIQSTFTDFPFIDSSFQYNCDEERLLGVSLTGVCDHPVLSNFLEEKRLADWLNTMKLTAIESATKYSKVMGIKMPAAITCIKPSGTVSQLVDSSSGIHLRHSPYYIRRVRSSRMDPISSFLIDSGVHYNPEVGFTYDSTNTWVFDFYTKSPKSSKFRYEVSALEQLNFWKLYQVHWCEHKPSYTCYVKDDEWLEVGAWIFKNWDIVSGISFLPYDGGVYQLAPFEEITKEKYEEEVIFNPSKLDWSKFSTYETSDFTEGAKEFACTGNTCGI